MPPDPIPAGLPLPRDVVDKEIAHLDARRALVFGPPAAEGGGPAPTAPAGQAPTRGDRLPAADRRVDELAAVFRTTHDRKPFGVALSGGGIRSATFNLGILQGLAERGLLRYVDYLSTVSGGGYIGSWLHGVIRNYCGGDVTEAEAQLSPTRNPVPAPPDTDPVSFLRKYSNYLAPRPGLFTPDSWVIVLIWLRNVLLNQLILVPTVAAGVLVLLLAGFLRQTLRAMPWALVVWRDTIALGLALLALAVAVAIASRNLRTVVWQSFPELATAVDKTEAERRAERRSLLVVPCVFLAAILIGCSSWIEFSWARLFRLGETQLRFVALVLGVFVLLFRFQREGGFVPAFLSRHEQRHRHVATLHILWMVPVTTAVTMGLLFGSATLLELVQQSRRLGPLFPWISITFAPPLVCLSFVGGIGLLVGLMGADYPDGAREWIARIGAMLALLCAAWTGVFLLAVFGPWVVARTLERYTATGVAVFGGWVATVGAGVLAGRSAKTKGAERPEGERSTTTGVLSLLINVAPTVFMIGYLLLIAAVVHATLPRPARSAAAPASGAAPADVATPPTATATYDVDVATTHGTAKIRVDLRPAPPPGWVAGGLRRVTAFREPYWRALSFDAVGWTTPGWLLAVLAGCVAVALVASSRLNINEFSIHHFYKNRLVRCYLGASNGGSDGSVRRPNSLTGFDPTDDFRLATLAPDRRYTGPYAIVNATLNLNAGSELATQERKAASFVFTPDFCGFAPSITRDDQDRSRREGLDPSSYRRTSDHGAGYSHPEGPTVGTALSVSGAAANPNWGYHTSGPMAFLLTVFDVRLGMWLGNPRRLKQSRYPGPLFAWRYLLAELLGQTTARSKFVNLSDGGHFENLGLYELVRRRCRYIIVGDGEEDARLTFESLGGAIRKCRADFGVEIDIDPRPIRLDHGLSGAHCVMGTILYPEYETAANGARTQARGYLFYLKASLSGDEPADVIEYRSRFPEFPHQSTVDQFFTESQFESYRRLGLHVLRDAFEKVPEVTGRLADLAPVFEALDQKWYAPIPVTPERASRLADDYATLLRSLNERPGIQTFVDQLLHRPPVAGAAVRAAAPALATPPDRATVAAALEVIQLMENVFTEFRLEHPASQANPRNSGWMRLFCTWAKSPILYEQVWLPFRSDYNELFQRFMRDLHDRPICHWEWDERTPRP